jgi:hypothetical protein
LKRDHPTSNALVFLAGGGCGELLGEGVEFAATFYWQNQRKRALFYLRATELISIFPLLILNTSPNTASPFPLTHLLEPKADGRAVQGGKNSEDIIHWRNRLNHENMLIRYGNTAIDCRFTVTCNLREYDLYIARIARDRPMVPRKPRISRAASRSTRKPC